MYLWKTYIALVFTIVPILAVYIAVMVTILFFNDRKRGEKIMSELDDLKQGIADVKQAATDEATRVEKVITDLRVGQNNPSGISTADVQAAVAELETVATNLRAVEPSKPASAA